MLFGTPICPGHCLWLTACASWGRWEAGLRSRAGGGVESVFREHGWEDSELGSGGMGKGAQGPQGCPRPTWQSDSIDHTLAFAGSDTIAFTSMLVVPFSKHPSSSIARSRWGGPARGQANRASDLMNPPLISDTVRYNPYQISHVVRGARLCSLCNPKIHSRDISVHLRYPAASESAT